MVGCSSSDDCWGRSANALGNGAPSGIGITSASQTSVNGSARIRQCRGGRYGGSATAVCTRVALATLMLVLAAFLLKAITVGTQPQNAPGGVR